MSGESSVLEVTAGPAASQKPTAKVLLVNSSGSSLVRADGVVVNGDTLFLSGAGAPTAATGADEAGIGSVYIDTTAGNAYLNAGTKAVPNWKLVTRAA